jgi:tRNA(Arg) A34 adenosine deaminase TadA
MKSRVSLLLLILSCSLFFQCGVSKRVQTEVVRPSLESWQVERDEIYSLLAYSVVLKAWQTGGPDQRGHNIGSVLVNPEGQVVFWARNYNYKMKDGTQHGEVRLMLGYLEKIKSYSLKGYTVYTSLEPCAQCSGMMIQQSIARTVYGQTDPDFGKAVERLKLDSSSIPNGYIPYPRPVTADVSQSIICKQLDAAYKKSAKKSITDFLMTDQAKAIYQAANQMLLNYQVKYPKNQGVLLQAIDFFNNNVNKDYTLIISDDNHSPK